MTFDEYVPFMASPASLAREASQGRGAKRLERAPSGKRTPPPAFRGPARRGVARGQPGGPAKVLAISEEWSSDCRRDIPIVARLADAAGLPLRIFTRDGQTMGRAPFPQPDSPNADLMADFLNRRDGETFQSIPIIAFYSKDFELLYRYTEFPAVYRKDRIRAAQNRPAPGETEAASQARGLREFAEMLASPFHEVWRSAALDEWTSILYERLRVGSLA